MAWTAGVGRSHFDHRAGVVFEDAGALREGLKALAESGEDAGPAAANKVAFVYTGQGSQWAGMGRTLYDTEPVARAVLDRCESVFREERGASLLDVMFGRAGERTGDLGDTAWEQPALYALECALTALWASVGIRPAAVLGHSVGELAAAQAAGVFSLDDGMRLAATRGTLLSGIEPGAMAAVFAPPARVAAVVDAANQASAGGRRQASPRTTATHQVVSGPVAGIEAALEAFRVGGHPDQAAQHDQGVPQRPGGAGAGRAGSVPGQRDGRGSLAGGGQQPDRPGGGSRPEAGRGLLEAPRTGAGGVRGRRGDVGGTRRGPGGGDRSALGAGPDGGVGVARVACGHRRRGCCRACAGRPATRPPRLGDGFVDAVAGAYRAGLAVRFEGLFAGEARRRISLPGYPFQRERHWLEATKQRRGSAGHPLLGVRHESARGEVSFETEVFPSDPAWLSDHRVFGRVLAPGALYGAMAATTALAEGSGSAVVEDMQLHNALVFPEQDCRGRSGRGRPDCAARARRSRAGGVAGRADLQQGG